MIMVWFAVMVGERRVPHFNRYHLPHLPFSKPSHGSLKQESVCMCKSVEVSQHLASQAFARVSS